jgi:DNA-binding XRE family transcriptional regulator
VKLWEELFMARPLREVRKERGIGVRRLSQRAPVSPRTIITTEKGESTPSLATIRKISRFLQVDPMEVSEFKEALEAQGLTGLPEEPTTGYFASEGDRERALAQLVGLMRDLGRWEVDRAYRRAFETEPPTL